jgi:23S rRNA pseudouridine2605 synthase
MQNRKNSSKRETGSNSNFSAKKTSPRGDDRFKKNTDNKKPFSAKSKFSDDKPAFKKKSFGEDKFADSPRKPSARGASKEGFEKKPYEKRKSFGEDKFADSPRKPSARGASKEGFEKKPYEKRKLFGEDKIADSPRKPSAKTFDSKRTSNSKSFSKDRPTTNRFEKKPTSLKKPVKNRTDNEEFEEIVKQYEQKPENITSKETFRKKGLSEDAKSFRNKTPMKSAEFKTVRKKLLVDEKNKNVNKKTAEQDLNFGEIRLNRFIANAGICSRREADTLIEAGLVNINGKVITEMGYKVKAGDDIRYNGQRLSVEDKIYILMNKPKDAITTAEDPEGRSTVFDLIEGKLAQRVFAVGRLDRNTTGVLLLTNDGDLAQRLMHPKFEVEKVYVATLNKPLTKADMWQMAGGIELEDGPIRPDAIAYSEEERKDIIGVEIHSGRNRIIHRMFEHMGYLVDKLDRVAYAGLTKSKLKRGEWRELNDKELKLLRKNVKIG